MFSQRCCSSALSMSLPMHAFKISRCKFIANRINFSTCTFQQWQRQSRSIITFKQLSSFDKCRVQPMLQYELRRYNSNPSSKLPPPVKKSTNMNILISWKSLLVVVVVGGAFMAYMFSLKKEKDLGIEKQRQRSLGKAAIGGEFDLIDHNGKPCSNKDFLGKWCLVYFGFTHCPDICPDELEKLGQVVDKIDASKLLPDGIHPIFITVDPARDSMEAIGKYVKEFHPKFLGLTGPVDKIADACKSFRVYFSAGPKDEDADYIVDHTIIIYLIDPNGDFVDYFGQTKDTDSIVAIIQMSIAKFNAVNDPSIMKMLKLKT